MVAPRRCKWLIANGSVARWSVWLVSIKQCDSIVIIPCMNRVEKSCSLPQFIVRQWNFIFSWLDSVLAKWHLFLWRRSVDLAFSGCGEVFCFDDHRRCVSFTRSSVLRTLSRLWPRHVILMVVIYWSLLRSMDWLWSFLYWTNNDDWLWQVPFTSDAFLELFSID